MFIIFINNILKLEYGFIIKFIGLVRGSVARYSALTNIENLILKLCSSFETSL